MKDRLRLGLRFDAAAMRRDLDGLESSDWIDHFVPQNCDGTWSVLPFRAPAGPAPIQTIYSDPSCDTYGHAVLLARCPTSSRSWRRSSVLYARSGS